MGMDGIQGESVKKCKHFTLEDRKEIESLIQQGVPVRTISKILNKHYTAIYHELNRLGLPRNEYNAEKADQSYEANKLISINALATGIHKRGKELTNLVERVEVIESQLQILFEVLDVKKR
jgi:IS30 family transposase